MIVSRSQRWKDKASRWVCAAAAFDKRDFTVDVVTDRVARGFIERHHYSGSFPATRLNVALFRNAPMGSELVGLCSFSVPMNQRAIPIRLGVEPNQGTELGRLVLLDSVGFNGESWLVAKAFSALKREKPAIRGVVSYADPIERRDSAGRLVKRGHVGGVYQALQATLQQPSKPRTLLLLPNGEIASERALAKIRSDDQGRDYAEAQLRQAGLPARQVAENGAAYVKRVCEGLERIRHPGNFAYAWGFDPEVSRHIGPFEPARYPKLGQKS